MVEVFVTEKLPHNFKSARLIVEKNFRAQMTGLVRRQRYACPPSCVISDQGSKAFLFLRRTVNIDE